MKLKEPIEEYFLLIRGSGNECSFCTCRDECPGTRLTFEGIVCAMDYYPKDYLDFEKIEKAIERGELE